MVAITKLALALSAICSAVFAAPTAEPEPIFEGEAPDFAIGPDNLARRQNYNQNYKTSGTVNFTPASNGYSVSFSGAGDFVVGKGWTTGTTRSVNYSSKEMNLVRCRQTCLQMYIKQKHLL